MQLEVQERISTGQILEIWQRIVDSAAALLAVPSVMINRLEPPELEILRTSGTAGNPFVSGLRMQLMGLYCAAVAERREPLAVEDARDMPEWVDSPTARAGVFAYLGYPLFWPNGEVFGTLCAVDLRRHAWTVEANDLLETFKHAIEAHLGLAVALEELNARNHDLEVALSEVKTLRGLLPICASCKMIRDDSGYWNRIESYLAMHSELRFSHGICPDCARTLFPDEVED